MSTCTKTGKVIHHTPAAAKAAVASLYKAGRGNPDYRAYPCPGSKPKHYHIGHSQVSLRRRIRLALRGRVR